MFALGSSIYEHFAATGKRVHKLVQSIGGEPVVSVGVGDDDEDIEEDFSKWMESLMTALQQTAIFRASDAPLTADQVTVAYDVTVHDAGEAQGAVTPRTGYVMGSGHAHSPQMLPVKEVRELHGSKSERSCVHVELELGMPSINCPVFPFSAFMSRNNTCCSIYIQMCHLGYGLDYKCM